MKTFSVEYTVDGQTLKASGKDTDTVHLRPQQPTPERPAEIVCDHAGHLRLARPRTGQLRMDHGFR